MSGFNGVWQDSSVQSIVVVIPLSNGVQDQEYVDMSDILRDIKANFVYDRGSPTAEWEVVEGLLSSFATEREAITRWLFEEYNGYVDTRTRAGLEFIDHSSTEGRSILKRLVSSPNPDDRDTALAIIEVLGDDDAVRMAVPLLEDKWTYIRLDAATVLRRFYPDEVARCLRHLLQEEAESVRDTASKLLVEMGKDSQESDRR